MSHITSPTALRLPIEPVLAQARMRAIATLIDGAHAPGQIALGLSALGADYYTGNCHKWMCAPKAVAFLHARSEHHASLYAMVTSWGEVAPDGPSVWDGFIGNKLFERRMQWQGSRDLSGFLAVPAARPSPTTRFSGRWRPCPYLDIVKTPFKATAVSGRPLRAPRSRPGPA